MDLNIFYSLLQMVYIKSMDTFQTSTTACHNPVPLEVHVWMDWGSTNASALLAERGTGANQVSICYNY